MPKIVVEGPDGRKFAFPDTMPRAEINAFMKQKYGTKAPNESVQDYLARYGREQAATEARAKDIDREATAVGRAEGERAAGRMGVSNPLEMAFAAPAIGLAQQEGGRRVFEREGTVLADEAAGLSAANAAAFFVPGMVNKQFGAQLEEGRRQQPLAAFAGDVAGGFGPGEIIGAGVSKAVQAIGPGMAALGRMFSRGPGPDTTNAIVGGTLGGIAPAETPEERARNVAVGAGLGAVARPVSKMAADFTTPGAPNAMPDAVPAGGYFGRQSLRPPGSGPSAREIETQQQWATATPIVTQARTTAQSAQQASDAALQSKAPADIARAKDAKKTLVGQLQEAQASRAGMDTPEDARLAETLASLTENTSDPVLLSTQISAAKTSLDRLLTDIGSPVEGNLIPVKTNILTRTQAPRSAAEGPQDRASVTRYAEGSDEVKPQGFGASTPNTPQQAARFETPGSPEYEAAVAKGLDMSQAGRMGRAREMGFDTDTVLYHGTEEGGFDAFAGPTFFARTKGEAGMYAADKSDMIHKWKGARTAETFDPKTVRDGMSFDDSSEWEPGNWYAVGNGVFRKNANNKLEMSTANAVDIDWLKGEFTSRPWNKKKQPQIIEVFPRANLNLKRLSAADASRLARDSRGNIGPGNMDETAIAALKSEGFDGVVADSDFGAGEIVVVFDPSNIRSVNAAFDPDKAASSTLLAAAPFAAVGGAGLTSERELGNKMKRDKKD